MIDRPRSTGAEDVLQPPASLSAVVVSSEEAPEPEDGAELSCGFVERGYDDGQRRHPHRQQQQQHHHQQQRRRQRRGQRPQQPIVIGDSPSPTGSVISISSDPDDDDEEDSPHRCAHYKHCVLVKLGCRGTDWFTSQCETFSNSISTPNDK